MLFDAAGNPVSVERLGIALEPEADYERRPDGGGGCEDPRITFVESLQRYLMTYTAFSPKGPRIALALSQDLFHWQRLGLATFSPCDGVDLGDVDNKDACPFPIAIPDPSGQPELAMLHRPLFTGTRPEETCQETYHDMDLHRESIWISYAPITLKSGEPCRLDRFTSHRRLAAPVAPWERLKIGAGTPPILTPHGWLFIYHGVSDMAESSDSIHQLCYSAGLMVLTKEHPEVIRYRSAEPVLTPVLPKDRRGTIANVVFPTGIDRRSDLGLPGRFDIYYGMNDRCIGAARLDPPDLLSLEVARDPPGSQV